MLVPLGPPSEFGCVCRVIADYSRNFGLFVSFKACVPISSGNYFEFYVLPGQSRIDSMLGLTESLKVYAMPLFKSVTNY